MKDDDGELVITCAANMSLRWTPTLDRMCRIARGEVQAPLRTKRERLKKRLQRSAPLET